MKMAESHLDSPVRTERKFGESEFLDSFNLQRYADYVWEMISYVDGLIQKTEPFRLIKTNEEAALKAIEYLVKDLNDIAVLLEPMMPETAEKIQNAIKENKMPSEPLFLRKQ